MNHVSDACGAKRWWPTLTASHLAAITALILAQALALHLMGSPAICRCGYVLAWYGSAAGPGTSQHILDWYTPTHVLHGVGFYLLLWIVAPRAPVGLRLAIAVGLEAAWEIVENTPLVIERYRRGGLAQGYSGDSILNSVSDTMAAIAGFLLAARLPVWATVALFAASEAVLLIAIRDNLLLNILQLIAPSEALSRWQQGG